MDEATCPGGAVSIKTPARALGPRQKGLDKTWICVKGEKGSWFGELGSMARFDVDSPTRIRIYMGGSMVEMTVSPKSESSMEVAGVQLPARGR